MSDSNETGEKIPAKTARKPLSLKRSTGGTSTVRKSVSVGRSAKTVVVEKRRSRKLVAKDSDETAKPVDQPKPTVHKAEARKPAPKQPPVAEEQPSGLTDREREARARALEGAQATAHEDADRRAKENARLEVEAGERRAEKEEEQRLAAEEEARRASEVEAAQKAEEESRRREEEAKRDAARAEIDSRRAEDIAIPETAPADLGGRVKKKVEKPKQATSRTRGEPKRRQGKLTIAKALDDSVRTRSMASVKRARERERRQAQGLDDTPQQVVRDVIIPETITVKELADRMAVRGVDIIKLLMKQGNMATINDIIDADTAQLIAEEYGHSVKRVAESDVEVGLEGPEDPEASLLPRAPVVTVMGHVDHGKTSLLDAIRQADVVTGEAGGITQHIGAYQVEVPSGQHITFLDTPGHAAFTQMRARGAQATDIVILVVAGDDGVMPQTVEAINHAKAAEVPIIVAINKMDKPGADPTRVRNELLQHEMVVEELGGDIQTVEVSAIAKTGLAELEEAILLQAEVLELKANPHREALGTVVEAKLDKGRGPVATVLVQKGTLKRGDIFVAGKEWGRVRALVDDRGMPVDEAGPAVPVEVLGLSGTPEAGDDIAVVETEGRAREVTEYRQRKERDAKTAASTTKRGSLEQMLANLQEEEAKEAPVLVKGDVQGSVEAIIGALENLGTDEVQARAIHAAVGGITESDVILAQATGAPIIGFNVRANNQARDLAEREGIEIRYYSVIYDLVDDVKAAMSGLLDPTMRETFLGNAEVLEVFNITKVGRVAGCRITEGMVKRGSSVRLIRDSVVIHEGTLSTLKRFKDEVKDVQTGQECGMAFENYQDIQAGDVIECFDVEEIARTL